jgi:hypothetical protein
MPFGLCKVQKIQIDIGARKESTANRKAYEQLFLRGAARAQG